MYNGMPSLRKKSRSYPKFSVDQNKTTATTNKQTNKHPTDFCNICMGIYNKYAGLRLGIHQDHSTIYVT